MSDNQQAPVEAPVEQQEAPVEASTADLLNAALNASAETSPEAPTTPVEPVTPEPPKDDRAAAKFAALSRKERQLRQQEKALKAQQAEIQAMKQQFEQWKQEKAQWETEFTTNPLDALKKRGTDYKKLTEEFIMKPEETPEQKQLEYINSIKAELQALKDELKQKDESARKQAEEAQKLSAEQAKNNYLEQLTEFISKNTDKYELVANNKAFGLVFDVMDSVYKSSIDEETGESTYKTAADFEKLRDLAAAEVEDYLFQEAKKLVETNKLKSLIGANVPKQEPKKSTQPVTLSNTLSQQVPTKSEKFLSNEESLKYAASLIKFTE